MLQLQADDGYAPSDDSPESPQSPTPEPPTPQRSTVSSKKRILEENENIENTNNRKRRRFNNICNEKAVTIDLCDDDSDDDDDDINMNKKPLMKMLNDIDIENDGDFEDKHVLLWGISIGSHCHHWTQQNKHYKRPKLVFNKFKSSFDIYLNSTANDYVKVTIQISNVSHLFIPKDPSLFRNTTTRNNKPMGQYLNVIFWSLNKPLTAYKWLEEYHCPLNLNNNNNYKHLKHPNKSYITMIIDSPSFHQFSTIVLSKFKCNLMSKIAIIEYELKKVFLRHFKVNQSVGKQWKTINKQRTIINATAHCDDCDDSEDDEDDEDEESDSDSSLSSIFSEYNNNNKPSKDYKVYITNSKLIEFPHHNDSLLYLKDIYNKKEPYYLDEKCYWFFPEQHGHKEEVFIIRQTHFNRLYYKQWLNDDIINFGIKYIYSSWPASFKQKCLIFNNFFFTALKPLLLKENNVYPNNDELNQIQKLTKNYPNIFDREYLIIPICVDNHWELIIIWNHHIIFKDRNNITKNNKCYIVILDSLNRRRIKLNLSIFKIFKRWLNLQSYFTGNSIKMFNSNTIKKSVIQVPKQPNGIDCGCFLLRNVSQFGKDGGFNINQHSKRNWYSVQNGVKYRNKMIGIIHKLIKEQQIYIREMYKTLKRKETQKLIQKFK